MIVAVGSDKGSPGATTLATALALVWPTRRVLCEIDPCGADLPFRLLGADGQHLRATPSITTLAVDARPGSVAPQLEDYAQASLLDVPVIPSPVSPQAMDRIVRLLPAVVATAAAWPGTAIVDVGRLQPWSPALVVARQAAVVLLVTRASTEGLGHLRARVQELAESVGDPSRATITLGVVVAAEGRDAKAAVTRTKTVLASIGSPVPIVGLFAHDPVGATALWTGPLVKKTVTGPLVRSARDLLHEMWQLWPTLHDGAMDPAPSEYSLMSVGVR